MFKKHLSLFLALLFLLSCAGCSQGATGPSGDSHTGLQDTPEANTTADSINPTNVEVSTVEITLPTSFSDGQDPSKFESEDYLKENRFLSAKVNEDGSVTVTMSERRYQEFLAELVSSIDTAFAEYIESEDTPYIKGFDHNDDYTVVTMKVDRAVYEGSGDLTPLAIIMLVVVYHQILKIEPHTQIIVADIITGETLHTVHFPSELIQVG